MCTEMRKAQLQDAHRASTVLIVVLSCSAWPRGAVAPLKEGQKIHKKVVPTREKMSAS